ncbi:superoxide dismutase, partial [Suillus subaureus]
QATVVLKGDSPVTGTITFEQSSADGPVKVSGEIENLDPSSLRGFHIHSLGDLSNGCMSTGSHFNPYDKTHGAPSDSVRHVGDLGNIESDEYGTATISFKDRFISLNGPTSIVGRAVVVHAGIDDLGKGNNEESLKTGNAGGRAACGVIGLFLIIFHDNLMLIKSHFRTRVNHLSIGACCIVLHLSLSLHHHMLHVFLGL